MIKTLLKHGGNVSTDANAEGQNILHMLAAQCMDHDTTQLLDVFMVMPLYFISVCRTPM